MGAVVETRGSRTPGEVEPEDQEGRVPRCAKQARGQSGDSTGFRLWAGARQGSSATEGRDPPVTNCPRSSLQN